VLIEVRRRDVSGLRNGNQRQRQAALRHAEDALQKMQIVGQRALVKNVQLVLSGRDPVDAELARFRRHSVPRRVHNGDDGAHQRVDLAEDPHDAGAPEGDAAGGSRSVQRQIERLAREVGKRVVKEGIEVGKIHRAAHGHGHHVRLEGLVLLLHFHVLRRGSRRGAAYRFEPQHHTRIVPVAAHRDLLRIGDFHLAFQVGGAQCSRRRQPPGQARTNKPAPGHSDC